MISFLLLLFLIVSFCDLSSLSPSVFLKQQQKTHQFLAQQNKQQSEEEKTNKALKNAFYIQKIKFHLGCIIYNMKRDKLDRYAHLGAYLIDRKNQTHDGILHMHYQLYSFLEHSEVKHSSRVRLQRDFALIYSIVNQTLVRVAVSAEGKVAQKVSLYFSEESSLESLFLTASILSYYAQKNPYSCLSKADFSSILQQLIRPILESNPSFVKQIRASILDSRQENKTMSVDEIIDFLYKRYRETKENKDVQIQPLLDQIGNLFKANKHRIRTAGIKKSLLIHSDGGYITMFLVVLFAFVFMAPFFFSPSFKVYIALLVSHIMLLVILSSLVILNSEFTFKRVKTLFLFNQRKSSQSTIILSLIYLSSCIITFHYLQEMNFFLSKLIMSLLFSFGFLLFVKTLIGELKIIYTELQVYSQKETSSGLIKYSASLRKFIRYRLNKEKQTVKFLLIGLFVFLLIIFLYILVRQEMFWKPSVFEEIFNQINQIIYLSITGFFFTLIVIPFIYLHIKNLPFFQNFVFKKTYDGPFEKSYQKKGINNSCDRLIQENNKISNKIMKLNLIVDVLLLIGFLVAVLLYNFAQYETLLFFTIVASVWFVRWCFKILFYTKKNISYIWKQKKVNRIYMTILIIMILLSLGMGVYSFYVGQLMFKGLPFLNSSGFMTNLGMGVMSSTLVGSLMLNRSWYLIKKERKIKLLFGRIKVWQALSMKRTKYADFVKKYA